jgi:hypothetical protein
MGRGGLVGAGMTGRNHGMGLVAGGKASYNSVGPPASIAYEHQMVMAAQASSPGPTAATRPGPAGNGIAEDRWERRRDEGGWRRDGGEAGRRDRDRDRDRERDRDRDSDKDRDDRREDRRDRRRVFREREDVDDAEKGRASGAAEARDGGSDVGWGVRREGGQPGRHEEGRQDQAPRRRKFVEFVPEDAAPEPAPSSEVCQPPSPPIPRSNPPTATSQGDERG